MFNRKKSTGASDGTNKPDAVDGECFNYLSVQVSFLISEKVNWVGANECVLTACTRIHV